MRNLLGAMMVLAMACGGGDEPEERRDDPPAEPTFCELVCNTLDCLYEPDPGCERDCERSSNSCTHDIYTGRALDQAELCGEERGCSNVFQCINDDGGLPVSDALETLAARCYVHLTYCGISEESAEESCYRDIATGLAYLEPDLYRATSDCIAETMECSDETWRACWDLMQEPASCQ